MTKRKTYVQRPPLKYIPGSTVGHICLGCAFYKSGPFGLNAAGCSTSDCTNPHAIFVEDTPEALYEYDSQVLAAKTRAKLIGEDV